MKEIWKPIKDYEEIYIISNLGRVKSLDRLAYSKKITKKIKGGLKKITYNKNGYPFILLRKNGISKIFSIHRLLAIAFIPNPENKPQVNHKNGIKTDYRIDNLEWCTRSENMQHAVQLGLKKGMKGKDNPNWGKKGKNQYTII